MQSPTVVQDLLAQQNDCAKDEGWWPRELIGDESAIESLGDGTQKVEEQTDLMQIDEVLPPLPPAPPPPPPVLTALEQSGALFSMYRPVLLPMAKDLARELSLAISTPLSNVPTVGFLTKTSETHPIRYVSPR